MGALFNLLQMKIAHGKNLQSHGKNLQGLQKTPTHPQRLFRNFYARPPSYNPENNPLEYKYGEVKQIIRRSSFFLEMDPVPGILFFIFYIFRT